MKRLTLRRYLVLWNGAPAHGDAERLFRGGASSPWADFRHSTGAAATFHSLKAARDAIGRTYDVLRGLGADVKDEKFEIARIRVEVAITIKKKVTP